MDYADSRDPLVPQLMLEELGPGWFPGCSIRSFPEIDSTNSEAIRLYGAGAAAGTVVVADAQTLGRGRMGREWISPARAGLYLSVLLCSSRPRDRWPLLTLACGTALARTVGNLASGAGVQRAGVSLKWPNDLLVSGRKAAGILLETCAGRGGAGAVVAGIGVNVARRAVPPGLEDAAAALEETCGPVPRRLLAVGILRELRREWDLFDRGDEGAVLANWLEWAPMAAGAAVWVVRDGVRREAVTRGVTGSGALRVEYLDGSQDALLAADVSIRSRD
jgi:BirA family transcriptional regulator, biotin operon repressor / biotin---[acetyl-CoA-carboxylase] ligase